MNLYAALDKSPKMTRIRIFLFLLLLFPAFSAYARLSGEEKSVEIRKIDSLNKVALFQADNDIELSWKIAKEAHDRALKIYYINGEAMSLGLIANYYLARKKYQVALKNFFLAANLVEGTQYLHTRAFIYYKTGLVFYYLKRWPKSESYLLQAANFATRCHDSVTLVRTYLGLGILYKDWVIEPEKNLNLQKEKVMAMLMKSKTYLYLGMYLSKKLHNPRYEALAFRYIGMLFIKLKDYPIAIYNLTQAIKTLDSIRYYQDLGTLYTLIGHIYQLEGDTAASFTYDFKALEARKEQGQNDQVISSLQNLGTMHFYCRNYDSAFYYINLFKDTLDRLDDFYLKYVGYGLMKELYLKKKDYKSAFNNYQKYLVAKDCVTNVVYRQEVSDMEAKQMFTEMEKKNEVLKRENLIQKLELSNRTLTTMISLGLAIVITGFFLFAIWVNRKLQKSKQNLQNLNTLLDYEIKEKQQTENLLQSSEKSYRLLAENSMDMILHMDKEARLLYVSPTMERMFGYSIQELHSIFKPFLLVHPEFYESMAGQYRDMINQKIPFGSTYLAIRKDGTTFWAESLANPLFNDVTGEFEGTLYVVRDITERVRYEESLAENAHQKEVLLREIHHRVKNNFAILISLMNMQKFSSHNKELHQLISELQMRVRAMSLVHELLYRSENLDFIPFNSYAKQLINIVASTNRGRNVKLITNMEPCILNIEIALPLGLIINELLTNAYKYAFEGRDDGEVRIDLISLPVNEQTLPGNWKLSVVDNGNRAPGRASTWIQSHRSDHRSSASLLNRLRRVSNSAATGEPYLKFILMKNPYKEVTGNIKNEEHNFYRGGRDRDCTGKYPCCKKFTFRDTSFCG